jgi:hypothetical protein
MPCGDASGVISTRNELIAEAFYLTRDIEKYGSGYWRVRKAIADYPTMKFIIATPVFNGMPALRRCIGPIRGQGTGRTVEIVER